MRHALLIGALVVVAVAAAGLGMPGGGGAPPRRAGPAPRAAASAPVRPKQPPVPGRSAPRRAGSEPELPIPTPEMRTAIAEKARGAARPGMAAFRAFSDLYVDANLDLARRQAESEKITLAEVRELTHFGHLVLATQRVPEVEEILGRSLSDDQRDALAALMVSANDEFKARMRELVASGASEAQRWDLIRATQAAYLARFYASTGMDEAMLDDLLAGNMLLPGAPGSTEPPAGPVPPADPVDRDLHPARPH